MIFISPTIFVSIEYRQKFYKIIIVLRSIIYQNLQGKTIPKSLIIVGIKDRFQRINEELDCLAWTIIRFLLLVEECKEDLWEDVWKWFWLVTHGVSTMSRLGILMEVSLAWFLH